MDRSDCEGLSSSSGSGDSCIISSISSITLTRNKPKQLHIYRDRKACHPSCNITLCTRVFRMTSSVLALCSCYFIYLAKMHVMRLMEATLMFGQSSSIFILCQTVPHICWYVKSQWKWLALSASSYQHDGHCVCLFMHSGVCVAAMFIAFHLALILWMFIIA